MRLVTDSDIRRWLRWTLFALALTLGAAATPVRACPMCKAANEADQGEDANRKPMAYMYSILFMLAMPATLLGSYGVIFWRMTRRAGSVSGTDDSGADPLLAASAVATGHAP